MTPRGALAGLVLAGLTLTACGGSETPTGPTDPPVVIAPTVISIAPTSGPTAGGTAVAISGANFSAGAAVTIGGVAATAVTFVSSTSIQATTGAHAAGAADVTVTVDGRSSTLASAFTYVTLPPPTISGISPSSGSTAGGTTVTLTGTNFASGATLTIGGVAATGVTALSATSLRAVTGPRAAGVADVVVAVGTQSATLARAFTYSVPAPNPPPVITALVAQSTRANAPSNYADLGEEIVVTATVQDAETPVSRLVFEWSADGGTFTGTGPSVRWRAPTGITTPAQSRLTVKVTEPLDGAPQSVSSTATVRVHDSIKEISELSVQFLLDFSDQKNSPEYVVRNFYTGCAGRAEELIDITNNRLNYTITSYKIGTPTSASINFGGTCAYANKTGVDGCVGTPAEWKAVDKRTNLSETSTGTARTTAVYRSSRWWLCDSNFEGTTTRPFSTFIR
ncbi:MAG: IPT/TIG domain-containing protein [Vicinamibacterales bacterium]|nr:IPT/TIG domain-containing protein [Vicinamibacterales bacterium]